MFLVQCFWRVIYLFKFGSIFHFKKGLLLMLNEKKKVAELIDAIKGDEKRVFKTAIDIYEKLKNAESYKLVANSNYLRNRIDTNFEFLYNKDNYEDGYLDVRIGMVANVVLLQIALEKRMNEAVINSIENNFTEHIYAIMTIYCTLKANNLKKLLNAYFNEMRHIVNEIYKISNDERSKTIMLKAINLRSKDISVKVIKSAQKKAMEGMDE